MFALLSVNPFQVKFAFWVQSFARVLRQEGDEGQAAEAQWCISRWKNALVDPEAAAAAAEDEQQAAWARLYGRYQRQLRAYNAVDLDDLIVLPVALFTARPEILEAWQARIRYLLVDEYQDTNGAQYQLVRRLVGPRGALTVVGDDDQSIYAWRGARPENLAALKADFPQLTVIKLEQNYRSTGCILKAANRLIGHNPHLFPKRLWSELGFGEPIRVLVARDEEHEAERVVSHLLHHRFQHRTRHRDYAILYRGNHQSRVFEKVLREHRIPYRVSGGTSFFAHREVKDVLAYLRLLVNEDDDAAFLRVVNTPRREIGPGTVEKLARYAAGRGVSLCTAAYELGLAEHLPARAVERLRHFVEWLAHYGDRARREDPVAVARDLLRDLDYAAWLEETSGDPRAAERRQANVDELLDWMARLAQRREGETGLADLVAHMSLMDVLERTEDEGEGPDAVQLMTLHAAKGLEFAHVYLVGFEEELLPHRSSLEADQVEEERRLAYVGITRARRSLVLSLASRRRRGGELRDCEPSRFIGELPQEDLVWDGGEAADPEERRQRGRAHLENLRAMLEG